MEIGIIGGGAVGLLTASYLHENKHNVTLFTRTQEQANLINELGIILSVDEKKKQMCINAKKIMSKISVFDLLIVCVKQYHLDQIVNTLTQYEGENILFLQNGMSHIDIVNNLDISNCFIGIVEHGALKTSANEVTHTGKGIIRLGCLKGNVKTLTAISSLHTNDFPIKSQDDWEYILKQKCLINCVINPLTSIFNVRNGELINNEYFLPICKLLFNEVATVLELSLQKEWEKVVEICEKTAQNYSSMNRDLFHGRQTEIESMLGFVKKMAIQKKINVPTIELVYNSIKGLEKKKG
ncbi:2-dehydropantoate 2-reductase [Gottfriedia sp. NPDC056225]|uniref:2-dehydropantoate 2-reductase n=1 Tax=Gottfriedia sp. NPDC056225 TaxID=3345751 RepID=UPI001559C9EC|nr:2-dehydropantoate 2-reductase [Arthrobacter citreus]